jgi:capsular polysaccharide biosynthesis protein
VPLKNYLRVNHLITVEQPTVSGDHRPELIKQVRQHLIKYFQPMFSGKLNKHNIYVSRNKAKYRKVLNESDLLPILKKYDFEVVFFEDYTMTEQIELAYSAKNIISLHGANLTNVMFMKPGGNVMEFRKNNDTENNYYYALTDSVDCNYFYQNCDYIDRRVGNFFDVTVDVDLLEKNIRLMMER